MARITGEWLSGPVGDGNATTKYRGERLGLPESGPGSIAGSGRRIGALTIDWLMGVGIAALLVGQETVSGQVSTITLLVWMVIGILAVSLFSFTPGQYFLGLQVARVDNAPRVGIVSAVFRSVLLAFVIPGLITDIDGRGVHDRVSKTVVVRSR